MVLPRLCQVMVGLAAILASLPPSLAATTTLTNYITVENSDGQPEYLALDRKPALYTGNFGDCLGDSWIKVTRFDASYYHDNMTIIFDIEGIWDPPATAPNLTSQAVMSEYMAQKV